MKGKLVLGLTGILALIGLIAALTIARPKAAEGRALWESKGIEDYRFTLSRNCFCLIREPVVVEVRDGKAITITDQATGKSTIDGFELTEIFEEAATIDKLFARIEQAEVEGAVRIDVTYDKTYGYPTSLYIDQSEMIADEEIGYVVSAFEVLE